MNKYRLHKYYDNCPVAINHMLAAVEANYNYRFALEELLSDQQYDYIVERLEEAYTGFNHQTGSALRMCLDPAPYRNGVAFDLEPELLELLTPLEILAGPRENSRIWLVENLYRQGSQNTDYYAVFKKYHNNRSKSYLQIMEDEI